MKITSLFVISATPTLSQPIVLAVEHELSSLPFFQRNSYKEFSTFLARTSAKKAEFGKYCSLDDQGHSAHYYLKGNGLAGFVITDSEYPDRKAHSLVQMMIVEFEKCVPDWKSDTVDHSYNVPFLKDALAKFQNPESTDKIGQALKEIDAVKKIMHKNIEQTLGRGDDIDQMVQKSEDLSSRSKQFYKQSKALPKSCCVLQ